MDVCMNEWLRGLGGGGGGGPGGGGGRWRGGEGEKKVGKSAPTLLTHTNYKKKSILTCQMSIFSMLPLLPNSYPKKR